MSRKQDEKAKAIQALKEAIAFWEGKAINISNLVNQERSPEDQEKYDKWLADVAERIKRMKEELKQLQQ